MFCKILLILLYGNFCTSCVSSIKLYYGKDVSAVDNTCLPMPTDTKAFKSAIRRFKRNLPFPPHNKCKCLNEPYVGKTEKLEKEYANRMDHVGESIMEMIRRYNVLKKVKTTKESTETKLKRSVEIVSADLNTIESNYNINFYNINKGEFCVHTQFAKEKNVAALEFLAAIQKNLPNRNEVIEAFIKFMTACYKQKSVISRFIKDSTGLSEGSQLLLELRKVQTTVNQSITLMNHFKIDKKEKSAILTFFNSTYSQHEPVFARYMVLLDNFKAVAASSYRYLLKSEKSDDCEPGKNYYCFETTKQCTEGSSGDGGSSEDNGSGDRKASGDGSGEDDEDSRDDSSGDDDDDNYEIIVITPATKTKPYSTNENKVRYLTTTAATATTTTTITETTEDIVTDSPLTFEETKAELLRNFSEVTDGCISGNKFDSEYRKIREKYSKRYSDVSETWGEAAETFDKEKHVHYKEATKKLKVARELMTKTLSDIEKSKNAEHHTLCKREANCISQNIKKKQLQALNGYIETIGETPINVTKVLSYIKEFVERPEFLRVYKLLYKNKTRYYQRDLVKKYLYRQNELVKVALRLLDYKHEASQSKIEELKRNIWYYQVNFTFKTVVQV